MTASTLRVLITGARGTIGTALREGLRGRYALLRLTDIRTLDPARAGEEIHTGDLRDLEATSAAMHGIDSVVHLGGISVEDSWDRTYGANIAGTYNVFEGARRNGVRRVILRQFASRCRLPPAQPNDRRGRESPAGHAVRRQQGLR